MIADHPTLGHDSPAILRATATTPIRFRTLSLADGERCLTFARHVSRADVHRRFGTTIDLNDEAINRRFLLGADGVTAWNLAALSGNGLIAAIATVALCAVDECEIGLLVRSDLQRRSIGTMTLDYIVHFAVDVGCHRISAIIPHENRGALRLSRKAGFTAERLGCGCPRFVLAIAP